MLDEHWLTSSLNRISQTGSSRDILRIAVRCAQRIMVLTSHLPDNKRAAIASLLETVKEYIVSRELRSFSQMAEIEEISDTDIGALAASVVVSAYLCAKAFSKIDSMNKNRGVAMGWYGSIASGAANLVIDNARNHSRHAITQCLTAVKAATSTMSDVDASYVQLTTWYSVAWDIISSLHMHPLDVRLWRDFEPQFDENKFELITYYSCFISYKNKDEEFVELLYNNLKEHGVSCWYAPRDLPIGSKFREEIDRTIKAYDKLVIVLSDNSIKSHWVEKEVETAFEEEQRRAIPVLFPLKLDNSVFEIGAGWAADVRRSRNIGDFRRWNESQSFQNAFERLLRDLKDDVLSSK